MNKRRTFLTMLTGFLSATACSNNVSMRTLGSIIESSYGNQPAYDPDYPEKLPYASIAVSRKGLKRSLLILGRVDGDDLHWISADRGVVVTRHGRVVRTVGFTQNLIKTDLIGGDFFVEKPSDEIKSPTTRSRIIDLSPGNRYGIKVDAELKTIRQETIRIDNRSHQTTYIEENCVAPTLGWKHTNSYWLDQSGRIIRSVQHYAPEAEPFTIDITKAYKS